ncbi:hypothetical protein GCM10027090_38670 [Sinomonas soli]
MVPWFRDAVFLVPLGVLMTATWLQWMDSRSEHQRYLPPQELNLRRATSRQERWARFEFAFGSKGRGHDNDSPPTAETKARRTSQGWVMLFIGTFLAFVLQLLAVAADLLDMAPLLVSVLGLALLLVVYIHGVLTRVADLREHPGLLEPPRTTSKAGAFLLKALWVTLKLGASRKGREGRKETYRSFVSRKLTEFYAQREELEADRPAWLAPPKAVLDPGDRSQRIVVTVEPSQEWSPGFYELVKEALPLSVVRPRPRTDYKPRHLRSGLELLGPGIRLTMEPRFAYLISFCMPRELYSSLSTASRTIQDAGVKPCEYQASARPPAGA